MTKRAFRLSLYLSAILSVAINIYAHIQMHFGWYADISASGLTIENKHIKVVFDDKTGGIKSLVSKENGVEFVGGEFCVPTIVDNSEPDTWAHNIFRFDKEIAKMQLKSIELVENGAARAVVRVKHVYNGSYLTQDFILDTS